MNHQDKMCAKRTRRAIHFSKFYILQGVSGFYILQTGLFYSLQVPCKGLSSLLGNCIYSSTAEYFGFYSLQISKNAALRSTEISITTPHCLPTSATRACIIFRSNDIIFYNRDVWRGFEQLLTDSSEKQNFVRNGFLASR